MKSYTTVVVPNGFQGDQNLGEGCTFDTELTGEERAAALAALKKK